MTKQVPTTAGLTCIGRVGQNHTFIRDIRCIYGVVGREITIHTVIYGVYIRFWPTLCIGTITYFFGEMLNDQASAYHSWSE
jgi:hypothetical protein